VIKYIFSTFLILITLTVSAQKKSVVHLIKSKSSQIIKLGGKNVLKVYQGVFQQDYSVMRSDSAYFYVEANAFDAFSHVNITQGDTMNIFSDKLNYNGNTKVAILTDNVKMVDKDATLTTNYLTYNTATRIGTYTGGGKLINRDNTLTSKNGYYFAFSRDAYFRYNVVLVTPDALIKTDTLRYNSGSRIAYFYGPTNIYDTKDKKDTLYTENGLYNTVTEQAFFGKKNLYKQSTKTLKGDSLFYDKLKGYGRAVKHVTFHDREQNITLKGDLATYYKAGERTVVTQDPYVIIVTEEKDSTRRDTLPIKTGIKAANPIAVKTASLVKQANALAVKSAPAGTMPFNPGSVPLQSLADTVSKIAAANPTALKAATAIAKKNIKAADFKAFKAATPFKGAGLSAFPMAKDTVIKANKAIKRDSIYISADILETQILTYKDYKSMLENQRLSSIRDTSVKVKKLTAAEQKKVDKFLTLTAPKFGDDTTFLHRNFFGKPKPQAPAAVTQKGKSPIKSDGDAFAKGATSKQATTKAAEPDNIESDPFFYTKPVILSDTARVRIIKAYHNAKLFKSDLQAKADSMFYSYSDSTLKCYVQPLIWTQGSQLSGDTITMQMKNKKLDNMNLFPSSFIVNIEKGDSTHFNQIAGKKMKGFFKSGKLDRMFIVGNAESIYFTRDSLKRVDGMQRSLSSRMRIYFKQGSANNIFFITKPEHRYGPLSKFTEEDRILKGFIWKPKERPVSKEAIIPSYNKRLARVRAAASKKPADVDKSKNPKPGAGINTDSLQIKPILRPTAKAPRDSVNNSKVPVIKATGVKAEPDSVYTKKPSATQPKSTASDTKQPSAKAKSTSAVTKP
jgi:lipopolysaccharide export system protein LptA